MPDWTAIVVHSLGRLPGTWDVLAAGPAPETLCGNYDTAEAAYAAIRGAGMVPIREDVAAPPFDAAHDRLSCMRFGRGDEAVIMVRRHQVIMSPMEDGMPGRNLLVTKLKGGAGATTTARELAVVATRWLHRVALIDLDAQGGVTRWWNRRNPAQAQQGLPDVPCSVPAFGGAG